jgi:YbbR domain-containing protein
MEGRVHFILVVLFACTPTPEVGALDPYTVDPGQTIRILGRSFDAAVAVTAVDSVGVAHAFSTVEVSSETTIEATVPDTLASGNYSVRVEQSGKVADAPAQMQVRTSEGELLCGKQRAVSEYSQVRKEASIERFDPTRDPERWITKLALNEIKDVEYEVIQLESGNCDVIRLKMNDGRSVVFADDDTANLKARSQALAKSMGKKLNQVTSGNLEGY